MSFSSSAKALSEDEQTRKRRIIVRDLRAAASSAFARHPDRFARHRCVEETVFIVNRVLQLDWSVRGCVVPLNRLMFKLQYSLIPKAKTLSGMRELLHEVFKVAARCLCGVDRTTLPFLSGAMLTHVGAIMEAIVEAYPVLLLDKDDAIHNCSELDELFSKPDSAKLLRFCPELDELGA